MKSEQTQHLRERGLCVNCCGERDTTYARCSRCLAKHSERRKERRTRLKAQGLCVNCSTPSLAGNTFCLKCWFTNCAQQTARNYHMGGAIHRLFDEQNGRCAYTDEVLVPGVNASLDHKTPIVRGGSNDISNLQWVTKFINNAKFNLTHEEFIAQCPYIARKHS